MLRKLLVLFLLSAVLVGCAHNDTTQREPTKDEKLAYTYFESGVSGLFAKDYTSALRDFLEAVKLDEKNAEYWSHLGLAYYGKQEFILAKNAWEKALKINPQFTDAHNNLGAMFLDRGQLAEAEKEFKMALKDLVYDKIPQVHHNLATLYPRRGQLIQAEQSLKLALKNNDLYCPAALDLGRLYKTQGDYRKAMNSFMDAIKGTCYSNSPEAHYEIALLYLKEQDLRNARIKLNEILARFPKSPWADKAELSLNQIQNRDRM